MNDSGGEELPNTYKVRDWLIAATDAYLWAADIL